jgi:uncharacterized phage protein gp47/JayE
MATYPLANLAAQVSPQGISAPSFVDVLESLKAEFRGIYGADAYLEPDSQDGQLLAVFARYIHECNMATVAAYLSFSPQTAVGVGLSNAVKINNIRRNQATKSQVNVTITGVAGTTIVNGVAGDSLGQRWMLPSLVLIPSEGSILVTAMAEKEGAVQAQAATITSILTPTTGWQSVSNPTVATPGQPIESDAELRARQEISPALNGYLVLDALSAALRNVPGVLYAVVYENDTNSTDSNGLPAHSIACVVKGGDAQTIAGLIFRKKGPGVATYGTTTVSVLDISDTPRNINFFIPSEIAIKVQVSIQAQAGYTSTVGDAIRAAVVAHINALSIGESVVVNRLFAPALLNGHPDSEKYVISTITAALAPAGVLGTSTIPITFIQKATAVLANVTLVVS